MSCVNSFGDEQLAVDLLADKLLFEALKFSVGPGWRGLVQTLQVQPAADTTAAEAAAAAGVQGQP